MAEGPKRFLSDFHDPDGGRWMVRRGQTVYAPGPLRVAVPLTELRNMLPVSARGRFDNIVLDVRHAAGSKDQEFLSRLRSAAEGDASFVPLVERLSEALT